MDLTPCSGTPTIGPGLNSASVYGYFVREDRDYAQPTFAADHGRLNLEARYNFEALETSSAWIG